MKLRIGCVVIIFFMIFHQVAWTAELVKIVHFQSSELNFSRLNGYDFVTLTGCEFCSEIGSPQLPVKLMHIAVPDDQKINSIELIKTEQSIFPGDFLIYPFQPAQVLSITPDEKIQFKTPDVNVYQSSAPFPKQIVKLLGVGEFQGKKIAAIAVYPLQYLPRDRRLIFYSEIEFKIVLKKDNQIQQSTAHHFFQEYKKLTTRNTITKINDFNSFSDDDFPYIIITQKLMSDYFLPLAEWKTQKGLKTKIVNLSWIDSNFSGRDRAERVRNFIRYAYENWHTKWVLLGGDTDIVPHRTVFAMDCQFGAQSDENDIPCDLYFSDLDGDWDGNNNQIFGEVDDNVDLYPEVFVGRASLNSPAEVTAWVNKVITYEKNPPLDFQKKMLFLCQVLWDDPYTDTGIGKNRIETLNLPDGFYQITKLYESTGNLDKYMAVSKINEGQNLINHSGHAWWSVMSLGNGSLSVNDALDLQNQDRSSTIFSIGCWAAAIDYDCIAEAFLSNPNGGAVAFIGNSRYGWGSPGNPGFGYSDRFDDKFFYFLFKEKSLSLGEAIGLAKAFYVPFAQQENVYRWCMFEINLLGDPETPLWTDTPGILSVIHPLEINTGESVIIVTVSDNGKAVENARVCLMQEDVEYQVGMTNRAGEAKLNFITDNPSKEIKVTVTAANFLPYEGIIQVITDKPYLSCDKIVVNDIQGNSDHVLNPGEMADLSLTLKNYGSVAVDSIAIRLLPDSANLEILQNETFIGQIPAGDQVVVENAFSVRAGVDCENGDVLQPVLVMNSATQNWCEKIALVIGEPMIKLDQLIVHDANDNQILETDESAQLVFYFKNNGQATGNNVVLQIFSNDLYVTVSPSSLSFERIEPLAIAVDSINITIDPRCPTPRFPNLLIKTSCAGIDTFENSITLSVGNLGFYDDMESGSARWELPDPENNTWHLSQIQSHSGQYSWYCGQEEDTTYIDNCHAELITSPFSLGKNAQLSFWLWYDVAIYSYYGYEGDGVYVEFFDGSEWYQLDFIGTGGALPPVLMGNDWLEYQYDLSTFSAISNARLKFRFISDPFWKDYPEPHAGIFVDDVNISYSLAADVENGHEIPVIASFALNQNYPNPFNNFTKIRFKIKQLGTNLHVLLKIYNVLGREVKTLVDQKMAGGEYEMIWDGRDNEGNLVTSGMYFYRLNVGNYFNSVKKMILLK